MICWKTVAFGAAEGYLGRAEDGSVFLFRFQPIPKIPPKPNDRDGPFLLLRAGSRTFLHNANGKLGCTG